MSAQDADSKTSKFFFDVISNVAVFGPFGERILRVGSVLAKNRPKPEFPAILIVGGHKLPNLSMKKIRQKSETRFWSCADDL